MSEATPILELKHVSKSYGSGDGVTHVLADVNLSIREGEFVAILGFSGSGKTTLISTIAGLVQPDAGEVLMKGKPVTEPGPERGLVFQSYSLMPWLTVHGNIMLAVETVFPKATAEEREARVARYIAMVGLSHARDRKPAELSGGMRQRVGIARALAMSPEVLLLDEPLSALDALTRSKLQDEIERIWEEDKKTVVLITNDVDEALLLADRVIPLTLGPGATLDREFVIDLPRPRDRTAANHDPEFKRLRAEITQYLMDMGIEQGSGEDDGSRLPDVVPVHFREDVARIKAAFAEAKKAGELPKAWAEAARPKTGIVNRYVEFDEVKKIYPTPKGPLTVVDGFDLEMKRGEFISLIGHSGCGKSTVLTMVAGLTDVSMGGIILDGREVDRAGPDRAVVFQAPSLFPWLTAKENVLLGCDEVYPTATRAEKADVAEYYLARVGLGDAMDKPASDMSNGMRQRVGIARAFALSPKLLLLDEPFGMLDSLTRWQLQEVLMEVWTRTQVTAICVTHDVDEAILLADRVVMMTNGPNAEIGRILEVDLPRPRTRKALLAHPDYYAYREQVLTFLEEYEQGAHGPAKAAPAEKKAAGNGGREAA
ncbi:ABC transporter ATP-binding protein [Pinisolibacter aquiterrae]|uniref:ABC transporter ATP-binding protein n=1 Tax=Pinisolibacter aquiterrae TaxID=2815579 RepID=UPI001C3D12A2|nr:nitrate ABC transporter ATP-binding protein [Pinisolibacter aquiterrae]MBV5266370.1 ATP-binding cassette domain-containing protein [Pinisolibacter aquiterrae]MCC8236517.1 nitrate ABC transporter ATP-binding protein [Pinisolibacter aquiterrae]